MIEDLNRATAFAPVADRLGKLVPRFGRLSMSATILAEATLTGERASPSRASPGDRLVNALRSLLRPIRGDV